VVRSPQSHPSDAKLSKPKTDGRLKHWLCAESCACLIFTLEVRTLELDLPCSPSQILLVTCLRFQLRYPTKSVHSSWCSDTYAEGIHLCEHLPPDSVCIGIINEQVFWPSIRCHTAQALLGAKIRDTPYLRYQCHSTRKARLFRAFCSLADSCNPSMSMSRFASFCFYSTSWSLASSPYFS
jgi:hypothetical protein